MLRWLMRDFRRRISNEQGILPALVAGGLSMLGSFLNKPQEMQQGYDVVRMPQYSWTEPNRRLLADYVSGGLQSIQEGNPPTWWQNAAPKLRAGMSRENELTYLGRPGTRAGVVNMATAAGAMSGLKGKRAFTPTQQALYEYADRESQIDDYLAQLGVNVTQTAEQGYRNTIAAMPGGPETQIVNYMGGVTGGNTWGEQLGQIGGQILGNLDWDNMFSGNGSRNPNTGLTPWDYTYGGYNQYGVNPASNAVATTRA